MKRTVLVVILCLVWAAGAMAQRVSHLAGSDSPYLLQHADNPVDWYPWGQAALDRARAEGKPIFVSVGYSSCHWCHVMEEESFEDAAIAGFLNAHFVSIKIDRESRPDLDEQFMFVTQLLTGTSGWPTSVFLTPQGDPFFAGTYFPPDAFSNVLTQVRQAWVDDPAFVAREAARVTATVRSYLTRKAEAREVTPQAVAGAVDAIRDRLDPFNGGFGVAPKFPRAPLFLFLLDQADRTGDAALLGAVMAMLDGMLHGGIHDHVGGGFHRYAVDPDWHVPHFEKMLYTQALTGRLLVRAWGITGEARYRRAAERLFDFVLRDMRDSGGAFYSALDADSLNAGGEKVEGAFYTWTLADLEPLGDDAGLAADVFAITPEGDLDGATVLTLRAPVAELAAEHGMQPAAFVARLDALLAAMRDLRRTRPAPFLDRKIVVSWNAMMIETLAEAGHRLGRPEYSQAAARAARFIGAQLAGPDGLRRVWFDGAAGTPGQLADYAGSGLALVALHDFTGDRAEAGAWLEGAQAMAQEVRRRFGDMNGGYRMTEVPDGLTEVIPVDDTAVPSGNALALSLFARLSRRTQVAAFEQDAYRLAAALSGHAMRSPEQRGAALMAIQGLQRGEIGRVRHAAKGAVRVMLDQDRAAGRVIVAISIRDGWHINGHEPLEDFLIPTELSIAGVPEATVRYPDPVVKTLSFNSAPMALHEGTLRLSVELGAGAIDRRPLRADLTLQACSDEVCLQPEEQRFSLW